MRKSLAGAAIAILSVVGFVSPADAAVVRFANCTAMHKKFKGGVALPGAVDHRTSGHAKYATYRSTAWYNANSRLDRDHDHVACEQ